MHKVWRSGSCAGFMVVVSLDVGIFWRWNWIEINFRKFMWRIWIGFDFRKLGFRILKNWGKATWWSIDHIHLQMYYRIEFNKHKSHKNEAKFWLIWRKQAYQCSLSKNDYDSQNFKVEDVNGKNWLYFRKNLLTESVYPLWYHEIILELRLYLR